MSNNTEEKDPLSDVDEGKDAVADILSEASEDDFFDNLVDQDDDSTSTEASDDPTSAETIANQIPEVRGSDLPPDYVHMASRILVQYRFLPSLDYEALNEELADLMTESQPTGSLPKINEELQRVQGYKDRLSGILIDVIKCHNFKKRAIDILIDSWGKFTLAKNAEARKGDAVFRLSDFLLDFAIVESLLKTCTHVLKNLDSQSDNLSRRITVYQLIMKNGDLGRGALPDYNWERKVQEDGTFEEGTSELSNDGEIKPQDL